MIPKDFRIPVIVQVAIFFIPMNIYIIGDWIGAGIQWVFLRFVRTAVSDGTTIHTINSIILLPREMGMIVSGQLTGKSALASIFWAAGAVLLVIALVVLLYGASRMDSGFIRKTSLVNAGCILLFILSIFTQYGILFHGPAGIAIPVGIPVFAVIAYWQYRIASSIPTEPETIANPV